MKKRISYREYLIFGESFQRREHGSWIAQYSLVRQATSSGKGNDFPPHQFQFNAIFRTRNAANAYALRKAKDRIDNNPDA
jgi:hypothetical protein